MGRPRKQDTSTPTVFLKKKGVADETPVEAPVEAPVVIENDCCKTCNSYRDGAYCKRFPSKIIKSPGDWCAEYTRKVSQ